MTQPIEPNPHLSPEQLSAYVDRELSSTEAQEIDLHLSACHACALRILSAMQLKAATARAAQRFTAPPDALARLTAQLRPQPVKPTARLYTFRPAAWAALAAALALTIGLIGWQRTGRSGTLSAELLDQHLATLSSGASPEVLSTDRHTVKPWFQGKLPFSFNLPETLPADMTLKGGDLAYLDGQPAALLLFTIHKHEVSIFLTQRPASPRPMPATRSGFTLHTAATHDLRLVAVSDVNPADLDLLLNALVEAQVPRP